MSEKRLYLIDGANMLYRAYYAIRPLSTSQGQPTNALYGLARMLLKLLREEQPHFVVVCLDTAEPTFRDELFEAYKANRKAPPDDLIAQFPLVEPLIAALGIPMVKLPGFEADDLIGTLARRAQGEGIPVTIVSSDKDLMQLIDDTVEMLDEMKGIRVRREQVKERFGVRPDQVADVLALSGDQSDNVPGVRGVGPKTASKLIAEYGSLDALIASAKQIRGAIGQRLTAGEEAARLSRQLVTIDTNVPLKLNLEDLVVQKVPREQVQELFQGLEFLKLLDELVPQEAALAGEARVVLEEKDFKVVVNAIKEKKKMAIELLLDDVDPLKAQLIGLALACQTEQAVYIPLAHHANGETSSGSGPDLFTAAGIGTPRQLRWESVAPVLTEILSDPSIEKQGYDVKTAITFLKGRGMEVQGVGMDPMLASYVLQPETDQSLEALALAFLKLRLPDLEGLLGSGKSAVPPASVSPEQAAAFFAPRAAAAARLCDVLSERVREEGLWELLTSIELPLVRVLASMQFTGVKIDLTRLRQLGIEIERELKTLESQIHALAGEPFSVGSPKQLSRILFEKLGLRPQHKTKTGFSTSSDVLEELALQHELPKLMLRYRSQAKLKSTSIDALPKLINSRTGRVHTTFNQAATATGRLSSSDPNMQNIPIRSEEGRRIREAVIAEAGFVLISADYSQIELRVLAHLSEEPELLRAFAANEDVHALTASGIFGVAPDRVTREQRAVGKTVNFATIYGQTPFGLSKQLGISTGEAADYIDQYFLKYPRVAAFREEVLQRAREEGFVTTLFGRRRFFPEIESGNQQMRALSERMAFNTVFQGTAADIIKRAMLTVDAGLASCSARARLMLQVHDELVLEVPEADAEKVRTFVVHEMAHAATLRVPLIVDAGIGPNWAQAH